MSQKKTSKIFSDYEKTLERLYQIGTYRRDRKTLGAAYQLHTLLGQPAHRFPSVHVAGTNGKSSVSKKIAEGLQASGLKVGLFTSPHLICLCERIAINGETISREEITHRLNTIFDLATQRGMRPTFFDYLTVFSAQYFLDNEIDIAVYEVGLGGRLDATNMIQPILSVITSIGFDHVEILGNTLEKIAAEKAGIIREGVPVVVGPAAGYGAIYEKAKEKRAPILFVDSLHENYELENQSIAKKALEHLQNTYPITDDHIKTGICVIPPCRFQEYTLNGRTLVFDIAHNLQALQRLIKAAEIRYPRKKLQFIFGLSLDKDWSGCVKIVSKCATRVFLPQIEHMRLSKASDLQKCFEDEGYSNAKLCENAQQALQEAIKSDDLTIVCGSIYIMESILHLEDQLLPRDRDSAHQKFLEPSL